MAVLLVIFAIFGAALLRGWIFMIVVGIIHADWIVQLPTLGFWWAVLIANLLACTLWMISPSSGKE